MASNSPKEKAGYLTKQGKTVKNWRKRWIVLKNNHLHYFKVKDDPAPLDSIPLSECSCSFALYCETKKRSCLKLNTPRRTWYFSADTDEDIGQWLEALFLWSVPETREEDEVITAIVDSTSALQLIAASVVQYSNSGSLETFRDVCRTATLRVDAFIASIQSITKYNSSVKYTPTPNYNDFLKEVAVSSGSIRDTFLASVTLATEAKESSNDPELRRRLTASSTGLAEKMGSFKTLLLDENKGLRPQLRYGKQRAFSKSSPVLRSSSGAVPIASPTALHIPPITIAPLSPAITALASPPSPSAYASSPQFPQFPQSPPPQPTKGSSPRPLSQTLSGSPSGVLAQATNDEKSTQFEDLISLRKGTML